jgi:hypothetical protein
MRCVDVVRPIVCLFAVHLSASVHAAGIAWLLDGVTFTDGGTASGYFVYDADSGTVSTFTVSTDGGNTTAFTPYTYSPDDANPSRPTIDANPIKTIEFTSTDDSIGVPPSYRQLRITPQADLTDAGGTVAIEIAGSLSVECYNCGRFRDIASGNLVSDTVFVDGFSG